MSGYPQETVLINRQERSLHRVMLPAPHVLDTIAPPACGTCRKFESGLCRERREKVKADAAGCTSHQWEKGHARLLELVDALRLEPGRRWIIEAIGREYGEAEAKEVAYLAKIESGERPPVLMRSEEPAPFVPGHVNMHAYGGKLTIDWIDGENPLPVQPVHRRPALVGPTR